MIMDYGVVGGVDVPVLVGGVEVAVDVPALGSTTFTVRVAVAVLPALSVALYSIVCVPATDVSIVT